MEDLRSLFKVGQRVKCRNKDFDRLKDFDDGIVKEVYKDHIIVYLTEFDINIWCQENLNLDRIYPEYNFC